MLSPLQKQLRPASFRGVPFFVEPKNGITYEGGRRNQIHEYPQRDKPWAQDLGRSSRRLDFDCFVTGENYIQQANVLIGVFEQGGPGKLVHPWLGELTINIDSFRVRHNAELGTSYFHVTAVEAGLLSFPSPSTAKPDVTRKSAADLADKSTNYFAKVFNVLGMVNRVAEFALDTYGRVLKFLANPAGAVLGVFGASNLLGNLNSLAGLVSVPLKLGWSFAGLISIAPKAYTYGHQSSADNDQAYVPMVRAFAAMVQDPALAPPLSTSSLSMSERQLVINSTAINAHTRELLLANAVGLSSYIAGAVYDDVIAARNELLKAIDYEVALVTDDDVYRALLAARLAVYDDLTDKAIKGARLRSMTLPQPMPAICIAYDLYEDAKRGDEIAVRNKVIHPAFVFGSVKVLNS